MKMTYRSPFGPLPESPSINIYNFFFHRPDAPHFPPDQVLQVDALTGLTRTRGEFISRVDACAREMCTPTSEGGMGLADIKGVMVGIFSDNSLVNISLPYWFAKC
jgi:hypothetical protein